MIEEIEVTIDEIKNWKPDTYEIIDIREESAAAYGIIPGSVNFPQADLPQYLDCLHREKKVNPYVEANIFKSVENVNLSTVIAYKRDGVRHHFLDCYDDKKLEEE